MVFRLQEFSGTITLESCKPLIPYHQFEETESSNSILSVVILQEMLTFAKMQFKYSKFVSQLTRGGIAFSIAATKDVFEYIFLNICIKCWDWIIHQYHIFICIYSSCQGNSCFLTTTQINSFFSYLGLVTSWKNLQISFQLTYFDCPPVSWFFVWISKEDIVSYCFILYPWNLLNKWDWAVN